MAANSGHFDPYYKWLGIRPDEQPPHHYRLLGIVLYESDCEVIANAADRQMLHVRSFQSGTHMAETQRLLNELATARLCLLDPQEKAAYDARLCDALSHQQSGADLPPSDERAGIEHQVTQLGIDLRVAALQ